MIRRAASLMLSAMLGGWLLLAGSATADETQAQFEALLNALQIEETVHVMHDEGVAYGKEVGADMLPDADAVSWQRVVNRIHDADTMRALVEQGFADALAGEDLTPMLDFLQTPRGQNIVGLEIAARRAFLDSVVEEAARDRLEQRRDENAPVLDQIAQLIHDSDLIERNVTGALNSNLMFYNGLVDGGALEMSQDDILSDVWSQEDTVREDARNWMNAFLLMAYEPLAPEDLQAYVEFYRTPAGRVLNRAMFDAFNRMYEELSYILGRAVARHMQSEKL
ncbi:hypothetical protein SAMN05444398_10134 [Roseovarius pacificus]|uniref:DUF2059 domain-containing protein n=1 Tax=Roseovarius pacificus TaxID=337701 RepID=A0A1M6WJI3_9RHOB|nr:DUF2059 domain-containing protein [Roseovarius pacificus]GGO53262.1 hypothetical protein GCM10011315_10770 [Roseovarius pacificus]SHK93759.1 hypothetical protein SAMN05444398_10134 [Roseovarius pacificus]